MSLRIAAVLSWSIALGFGGGAPYAATYLLRHGRLPVFMGLFPMFGGGFLERLSPRVFAVALAAFAATCAADAFAGWLVWSGERAGAWMMIALLPLELLFWAGFALPIPPLFAALRFVLLAMGWASLR